MKRLAIVSVILSVLIFISCEKSNDLNDSVFIRDNDNPELPEYSEWGYNTFGAFYDREAFVSNSEVIPLKVITEGGNTSFIFQGELSNDRMLMEFIMPGFSPTSYTDMLALNNNTYDLKTAGWSIKMVIDSDIKTVEILEGNFQFRRVQKLNVDEKQVQCIVSGIFNFMIKVDGIPVRVTDGRFDAGVGKGNFYLL